MIGFTRAVLLMGACLVQAACYTVQAPDQTLRTPRMAGSPIVVSQTGAAALNSLRAQYGLAPVTPSPVLAQIAARHAGDMLANGFFSHVSSDGSTIVERMRTGGYGFCHAAENLARGQGRFDTVLRQWMTSPSHRANLLQRNVTEFGLVRAPGDLWVLVLGSPGC